MSVDEDVMSVNEDVMSVDERVMSVDEGVMGVDEGVTLVYEAVTLVDDVVILIDEVVTLVDEVVNPAVAGPFLFVKSYARAPRLSGRKRRTVSLIDQRDGRTPGGVDISGSIPNLVMPVTHTLA